MSNGALRTEMETACLRSYSSNGAASFLLRHAAAAFANELSSLVLR